MALSIRDVREADLDAVLAEAVGQQRRALHRLARAAGADYAGNDEYINKIKDENWFEFDTLVATPVSKRAFRQFSNPRRVLP